MYCIKESYTSRTEELYDSEEGVTDNCQDGVYRAALELFQQNHYTSVLDIGCGRGFKLMKYFREFTTLGLDLPPTVERLRSLYPDRDWQAVPLTGPAPQGYDLVICSDVVEHLLDPDVLMDFIKRAGAKSVIVSTPDRTRVLDVWRQTPHWRGEDGPPMNICHIREWTFEEFHAYMSTHAQVLNHFYADHLCQCVVFRKRSK